MGGGLGDYKLWATCCSYCDISFLGSLQCIVGVKAGTCTTRQGTQFSTYCEGNKVKLKTSCAYIAATGGLATTTCNDDLKTCEGTNKCCTSDNEADCFDLSKDVNNCGECGNKCLAGQKCVDGKCGSGCKTDADCTDPTKSYYNPLKPFCQELGETTGVCVECLENGITYGDTNTNNDRSSDCMAMYGDVKPVCGADFKCRAPFPCSTNADCIPDECCTADNSLGSYAEPRGECVPSITRPSKTFPPTISKFLCTT